jgi:diguanylate cyclase (GGDEF)-like protein/PAS domain S-box-containing protein
MEHRPAHADEHAPQQLAALIEAIPAITYVCEWDEAATLRYISPQIEDVLGFAPGQLLADQDLWPRRLHPEDRERVLAEERRAFAAEEPIDQEYRMVAADGRVVWLWDREEIVRDSEGRPVLSQGVLMDVTARRETEEAVRAERDRAQRYLDVAGAMIVVADPHGRTVLVNREFEQILGYDASEVVGRSFLEFIPHRKRPAARGAFLRLVSGEEERVEHYEELIVAKDGRERIVSWRNTVLRDEDGATTGTLHSGEDVTERRAAEEEIAYLAYHDALTGLPNRALLREHLELAVARARRHGRAVALLYLDLNNFKLVNDSLGHAAGDEVLKRVARRLHSITRATDLLARHGGDEFLLLLSDLEGTGAPGAEAAAAKLARALDEPFRIAGAEFQIGAAVGISLFPADAEDPDRLLQHADAAMYQAKRSDRGALALYTDHEGDPLERLSLTARLRWALERGELELYYQPIVRLADGGLHRVEALLRWREPQRGLLLPAAYIALAEDTGLIGPIGDWVRRELFRQAAAWRDAGHPVPVSFNASPAELRPHRFAAQLATGLAEHGLDPGLVCVEITESSVMDASERTEPALHELRELGVTIAIDDFGAGHSSLSRLRTLPVDVLKIDQSFITDVPGGAAASSMLTAILRLARALDMEAVAEGVESEAQRQFLVEQGCPLAQGFALGRPAPAAELRLPVA